MKWKRLWFAAALTVCVSYQVRAQGFGKIVGTVTDASGAVIVGAKITASEEGTGFTRSTVTSTGGTYTLAALPVGVYLVSGESAAFKNGRAEVSLDVNQAREVNFKLAPAQTEINVEINAAPPLLDTTDSTLGGLISGHQVVTLPLNGRDITGLMLLQPGVEFEENLMFPVTSNPSGSQLVVANRNRGPTGSSYLDGLDRFLKDTGLTERIKLQFRAEFFNIFDEHQFNFPGTLLRFAWIRCCDWHARPGAGDSIRAQNHFLKWTQSLVPVTF